MSQSTLRRWAKRAAPTRGQLIRALAAGTGATLVGTGLMVGAVTLMVFSAGLPSWRSIVIWLIVIEIIAFLRSPLRFAERMASHVLGYDAVTTWRTATLANVVAWPRSRWAQQGVGDVLERSLRDTDELQELWVRGVLPLLTMAITVAIGDVVIGWMRPATALALLVVQLLAVVTYATLFGRLTQADRSVRVAHSLIQHRIVSLSASAPDIAALGRGDHTRRIVHDSLVSAARAEGVRRRLSDVLSGVGVVVAAASAACCLLPSAVPAPVTEVATLWLAVATASVLASAPVSIEALVRSVASAERLDELNARSVTGDHEWPTAPAVLSVHVGGSTLTLAPQTTVAITGPSGSGKTTALEVMAALGDEPSTLFIDGMSLSDIVESDIRQHVRFVPSDPGLVRGYVRDTLSMGSALPANATELLRHVGLPLELNDRVEGLSRGERQRYGVVRGIVSRPDILLLDEPTSGLGEDDTRRVLRVLEDFDGVVIIATHDPLVAAWAQHTVSLAIGDPK